MAEQNYANHAKWVPAFHFFAVPVLLLNFVNAIVQLVHGGITFNGVVEVLTAAALVATIFLARIFALKVQDRVIRLEERIRMERLLPEDLRPRIHEFTPAQLVGLRFASDGELPVLARKVLSEKIQQSKAIKQMVQNWRADYLRA